MEISKTILKFKFHIACVVTSSLLILFLCYLAPSFLDILKYFWPLFVSTALFLVAVVVFGRTPPEVPGEKDGDALLDYVAGQTEQVPSFLEEMDEEETAEPK